LVKKKFNRFGNKAVVILQGEDIKFSHIAALHTEFLLVEKDTGRLYHWPYNNNAANQVAMETDGPDIDFSEACDLEVPKAKVSPLVNHLQLQNEQIVLLAAHSIRCTWVMKSGKVCTFYDNFFKGMCFTRIQNHKTFDF